MSSIFLKHLEITPVREKSKDELADRTEILRNVHCTGLGFRAEKIAIKECVCYVNPLTR